MQQAGIERIPYYVYKEFAKRCFGTETVDEIILCSMDEKVVTDDGFYRILAKLTFKDPRNICVHTYMDACLQTDNESCVQRDIIACQKTYSDACVQTYNDACEQAYSDACVQTNNHVIEQTNSPGVVSLFTNMFGSALQLIYRVALQIFAMIRPFW